MLVKVQFWRISEQKTQLCEKALRADVVGGVLSNSDQFSMYDPTERNEALANSICIGPLKLIAFFYILLVVFAILHYCDSRHGEQPVNNMPRGRGACVSRGRTSGRGRPPRRQDGPH